MSLGKMPGMKASSQGGKMPGMKASSQGGKMPGMKASSQGKRRFKSDLSVDMISPPMGDFRHTMHVGRGGDVFGDTSFLSDHGGKGGAAAERPGSPTDSTGNNNGSNKTTAGSFFTRNFRTVVRKTPERPPERPARRRAGSRDLSPPPPPVSPIIKNAISLPQLNMDSPNGCPQRALFPGSVSSSADDSFYTYGLQSGFVTLPRLSSRLDRAFQDSDGDDGGGPCLYDGGVALTRADSFTSFTVDLGPSLMSEVLSLIDDRRCLHIMSDRRHGLMQAEGDVEESGSDGEEERRTSVSETVEVEEDSPGMSSPRDTAALHHRERSNCSSRDEDRASVKTPDASMGSPPVVQPVMEAERFQRAADMLSRHYGGGTVTHGRSQAKEGRSQATEGRSQATEGRSQATEGRSQAKEGRSQAKDVTIIAPAFNGSQKTTYAFSEEEEIKV